MNAHKFVEYGQYQDEFFGTSIDSIRNVIKKNRVCVLNLHCQVNFSFFCIYLLTGNISGEIIGSLVKRRPLK